MASEYRFNMPTLLPSDEKILNAVLSKFIVSKKLDGERKFLFCVPEIGIWTWGRNNKLEVLHKECCILAVLDVEVINDSIIVLDLLDKN